MHIKFVSLWMDLEKECVLDETESEKFTSFLVSVLGNVH